MKICPVGAKLFHADGRTDRHDVANSHFLQFCENVYTTAPVSCLARMHIHTYCLLARLEFLETSGSVRENNNFLPIIIVLWSFLNYTQL